ncbi:MAG: hypothetical protein ACUVXJ_00075 [Phycisphaerae bacterium]
MDSRVKDIQQVRVPPADEALRKAFADLDAGLASWKAVLGELRAWILEQAQKQAEAHRELQVRAEQCARLQAELESRAVVQSQPEDRSQSHAAARPQEEERSGARAPTQVTAAEQPEPSSPASASPQAGAPTNEPTRAPVDWSSDAISKHIRVYVDATTTSTDSPKEAVAPQRADEDEALLASLDPETAKAIRVMRRMRGDNKSVRELLEQYQASRANTKADSSKKSWFRRGR